MSSPPAAVPAAAQMNRHQVQTALKELETGDHGGGPLLVLLHLRHEGEVTATVYGSLEAWWIEPSADC